MRFSLHGSPLWRALLLASFRNRTPSVYREERWSRRCPRAQRVLDVALDAGGDGSGAPVALEAVQVEAERLAAGPQVGVVEPALIGVDRVEEGPERALRGDRLGGVGQRDRSRVAGLEREV